MSQMLVGPILKDVEDLGLSGKEALVATAYYTAGPLKKLRIDAQRVTLAVRLDQENLIDWVFGSIDPVALCDAVKCLTSRGVDVNMYAGKFAHAKMYAGENRALIGSANLTTRGFSGVGNEALWRLDLQSKQGRSFVSGFRRYIKGMSALSVHELEGFIEKNRSRVAKARRSIRNKSLEARPPRITDDQRPLRLGSYLEFQKWLATRNTDAAKEILDRANGKGNLSGHIYRNYYGIRQYLIHSPEKQGDFSKLSEDAYKLSSDPETENDISEFVRKYATDEDNFLLDTWKTYLPKECGGRAANHGGTIGNMNRMLPLVAKYLSNTLGTSKK